MKYEEFIKLKPGIEIFVYGDFDAAPMRATITHIIKRTSQNIVYVKGHPFGLQCYDYREIFKSWDEACEYFKQEIQKEIVNLENSLHEKHEQLAKWNKIQAIGPDRFIGEYI